MISFSGRELLPQQFLQSLTVLREFLDPLVELVERHLVLEQLPAELWLVSDVRHLRHGMSFGGYGRTDLADKRC